MGPVYARKAKSTASGGESQRNAPAFSARAHQLVAGVLRAPGKLLDPETRAFMEPRFGHDFSSVRVHTDERAALRGPPPDFRGQEVGQAVPRISIEKTSWLGAGVPSSSTRNPPLAIQRKCACGGQCDECKREHADLIRGGPATVPSVVREVLATAGHPLERASRSFMERRFGRDFSNVRIHSDDKAAESAQAIGALAFTRGAHIVFAAKQYAPQSNDGRRLLAHELVHTVQQEGLPSGAAGVLSENGRYETEADRVAESALSDTERQVTMEPLPRGAPIQRKCAEGGWVTEYDGCSIPGGLEWLLSIDGNNPAGGRDTQFSDYPAVPASPRRPCDLHDACYQTCGMPKSVCDQLFFDLMLGTCRGSTQNDDVRKRCRDWARAYFEGVSNLGHLAYAGDQLKVCSCRGAPVQDFPDPPSNSSRRTPAAPDDLLGHYKRA